MSRTGIRYTCYPRTKAPPKFSNDIVSVFGKHEKIISTVLLDKGLTSDGVLKILRTDLVKLGFEVEAGKKKAQKIERPVFFGENGIPTLKYEVDAYCEKWNCGLEIEAGRALMGNAKYRDLIQALVMAAVDVMVIAVPNSYKYKSGGKLTISSDYDKMINVAETLFSHSRFEFPYDLIVIGY